MCKVINPLELKVSGRHKAIKYDRNLREIEETGWGKNIITGEGLDFLLSATAAGTMYLHGVAGTGNNPATITDSTLQAYAGKYSACQALTVERNYTTAPYYVKVTAAWRYYPGAFGGSSVNITEFGVVFSTANSNSGINATTKISSRALSVNGSGSPSSVAVQPDEYLDHLWEWTIWIPASALATISLSVDGVPTSTNTEARPACMGLTAADPMECWMPSGFFQGSEPAGGGQIYFNRIFPVVKMGGYTNAVSSTWVSPGPISTAGANISGTYASTLNCSSVAASTYTAGNYYRDYTFSWGLNNGNASPSIGAAKLSINAMMWQVSYSPAIAKVAGKKLDLTFRLSIANV